MRLRRVQMVISLAYSCTTLRVTALLRSMTFGSMPCGRFKAATPRSKVQKFNCGRAAVTSLAYSCTTLRVTALLRSMTKLRLSRGSKRQGAVQKFNCGRVAVISLAYSCTTLRVTARLRSMTKLRLRRGSKVQEFKCDLVAVQRSITFGSRVDDLRGKRVISRSR